MFDLESCIAFVTGDVAKILSERINSEMNKLGSTKSQWLAMYYIEKEVKISQNKLAEKMKSKEPTITRLVKKLEEDNIVERVSDLDDKRAKLIMLTDYGKNLYKNLSKVCDEFKEECLAGISIQDQEKFLEILSRMEKNSKNWKIANKN